MPQHLSSRCVPSLAVTIVFKGSSLVGLDGFVRGGRSGEFQKHKVRGALKYAALPKEKLP